MGKLKHSIVILAAVAMGVSLTGCAHKEMVQSTQPKDEIIVVETQPVVVEEVIDLEPVAASNGWVYLGHYTSGAWVDSITDLKFKPKEGDIVSVQRDVNLREMGPNPDKNYQFGDIIGVVKHGESIKLTSIDVGPRGYYWAEIRIVK